MFITLTCGLLALVGPAQALLRVDADAQIASARVRFTRAETFW